jgi:hypothetical protein
MPMKRFTLAAALLFSAIAAKSEIAFGPPRPLTADIAIGPVPGTVQWLTAASSGDQFLAGWNDRRSGTFAPRMTRLAADGELLDPTGIALPSGSGLLVGIGSSGREYLAVTTTGFFIVTRDGVVTRGDADLFSARPVRVISNGIDYLVGDALYGQLRVDRSGKLLGRVTTPADFAAGTFYVVREPGTLALVAPDGTIARFSVPPYVRAATGHDGEIALLCDDGAGYFIRRYNTAGAQLGADIRVIAFDPFQSSALQLAWDGTSYAVFNGLLIGNERGGAVVLEKPAFRGTSPQLVSSPHGALAVWIDSRFTNETRTRDQVAAALLRHDADAAAAHDAVISLSEHSQSSPRVLSAGGRQFVAFIEASGMGEEIVVVPADGGGAMLRFGGKDRLFSLHAASNGAELFVLWAEIDHYDHYVYTAMWHGAIVTPALTVTRFDVGLGDSLTDQNVLWTGSDFLVYGAPYGGWLHFAADGRSLPSSQPPMTTLPIMTAPVIASANGRMFIAYSVLFPSVISAGPLGWHDVYATPLPSPQSAVLAETDALGTAPDIAAIGGEALLVSQVRPFAIPAADPAPRPLSPQRLWSTLTPHVVARDGVFLVSAGGKLARIHDRNVADLTTLPESAGFTPDGYYFDPVLESVVPAEGPLAIFYSAPVDGRPPRILVRDLAVPERHRASAR